MATPIPNYELYGDLLAGRAPGAIHLEPIRERSSKHDWTIRVHQHRRLGQVFLFRTAGVQFSLGEIEHLTTQPTILVIAPGMAHGFRFSEDVIGDVLSIRLNEMPDRLREHFEAFQSPIAARFPQSETERFDDVAHLIEQLNRAYHAIDPERDDVMAALVDLILIYLKSDSRKIAAPSLAQAPDRRGRPGDQIEAFCTAIEDNFRRALAVQDYARQIGVSAPHLTRLCREVLGASPIALVRQRRILEAKRLLEYTSLSIAEIADRSGFRDAAFFSRTFKTHVGVTAKAYRATLDR